MVEGNSTGTNSTSLLSKFPKKMQENGRSLVDTWNDRIARLVSDVSVLLFVTLQLISIQILMLTMTLLKGRSFKTFL